jgi:hypothetical protein
MVKAETDRERDCSREIIKEALADSVAYSDAQERKLESNLMEDSARLVRESTTKGRATRSGQFDVGASLGSTEKYRRGWEIAFGGE